MTQSHENPHVSSGNKKADLFKGHSIWIKRQCGETPLFILIQIAAKTLEFGPAFDVDEKNINCCVNRL